MVLVLVLDHETGVQAELVQQELIGRLNIQVAGLEGFGRKVLHVGGDNDIRAAANRGCEDVTITRMAGDHRPQLLLPNHFGVGEVLVLRSSVL